jgi:hypothetical protein
MSEFAKYEVDVPSLKEAEGEDFIKLTVVVHLWMKENCRDKFTWVSYYQWAFVDALDAAHFKLRWG